MMDDLCTIHRSPGRTPLTPWDVHRKEFNPTRLGRRGFAPAEVRAFLEIVEVDLAGLHQQLLAAQEETNRLKDALREWQTRHRDCYVRAWRVGHEQHRRPTATEPVQQLALSPAPAPGGQPGR